MDREISTSAAHVGADSTPLGVTKCNGQQSPEALRALARLLARQAAREALAESAAVPDAPDNNRATGSEADDDGGQSA